jgi:hypothetical protein
MQMTDVMIHVNEHLNLDQKQLIESQLRQIKGVIAPRFNKEHLLLVCYNSDQLNSSVLLDCVKSYGYQTQLVGI